MTASQKTLPALVIGTVCSAALSGLIAPSAVFAQSFIRSTTPAGPSDLVDPVNYDVVLAPGDPLSVPVSVTVPSAPSILDVYLLQDLSGSFSDDIFTVRGLVPNLATRLRSIAPDTRFGVGSFIDKPVEPFGSSGDYVYQTNLPLTSNTTALQTTVNNLIIGSGNDGPESQLEALLQTAVRSSSEIGFRDNAFRTVVVATDATFHQAGDFSSEPANNGDAILNGTPPGTGEDFPSIAQVADALSTANIVPIFAVTSDVTSDYQNLVDDLGFGTVVTLSSNSSNLVGAVTSGLRDVFRDITLVPQSDDFGYVSSITPTSFTNVPGGATRTFDVSLLSDGSVSPDTLFLNAPGFGSTEINVTPVPEPSSMLSTLVFGALSVGYVLNRRLKNRKQLGLK